MSSLPSIPIVRPAKPVRRVGFAEKAHIRMYEFDPAERRTMRIPPRGPISAPLAPSPPPALSSPPSYGSRDLPPSLSALHTGNSNSNSELTYDSDLDAVDPYKDIHNNDNDNDNDSDNDSDNENETDNDSDSDSGNDSDNNDHQKTSDITKQAKPDFDSTESLTSEKGYPMLFGLPPYGPVRRDMDDKCRPGPKAEPQPKSGSESGFESGFESESGLFDELDESHTNSGSALSPPASAVLVGTNVDTPAIHQARMDTMLNTAMNRQSSYPQDESSELSPPAILTSSSTTSARTISTLNSNVDPFDIDEPFEELNGVSAFGNRGMADKVESKAGTRKVDMPKKGGEEGRSVGMAGGTSAREMIGKKGARVSGRSGRSGGAVGSGGDTRAGRVGRMERDPMGEMDDNLVSKPLQTDIREVKKRGISGEIKMRGKKEVEQVGKDQDGGTISNRASPAGQTARQTRQNLGEKKARKPASAGERRKTTASTIEMSTKPQPATKVQSTKGATARASAGLGWSI